MRGASGRVLGYIHSPNVCSMEKIGSYIWGQAEWIQEKTYILASLMCINSIFSLREAFNLKKPSWKTDSGFKREDRRRGKDPPKHWRVLDSKEGAMRIGEI